MFLEKRKTNGKERINATLIEIKATFRLEPKIIKEIIKAAIPIATFNP